VRRCALEVAWLDQKSFPLTYEDRRVIDDSRFGLIRPDVKEWNLQMREVRMEDEGLYRCTVNTNPVRNKLIMLFVRGETLRYVSIDYLQVSRGVQSSRCCAQFIVSFKVILITYM